MDIEPSFGTATAPSVRALIDGAVALQRGRCAMEALEASVFAGIVDTSGALSARGDETELALRTVSAELGAAVHVSDRTMQARLLEAHTLVHGFPDVHQALAAAKITKAHVRVIVDAGLPLSGNDRAAYVRRALELARVESPNRLKPMLAAVAEEAQAVGIDERHREARKARCTWVTDDGDGMSTLHAHLPSFLAHGILDRLDELARGVRGADRAEPREGALGGVRRDDGTSLPGARTSTAVSAVNDPRPAEQPTRDERTLPQIRADVLTDLLSSGVASTVPEHLHDVRGQVSVTVPVLTLAGLSDDGAVLDGVGPIDAETARELAGAASGWDRVMTHPVTGCVVAVDRYKPGKDLKRFLRIRDGHCRFPGCRRPARRSDIDHSTDWARGGKTHAENLAHLCEHHHIVKHAAGWTITHRGAGVLEFTSPQGRTYVDTPPRLTPSFRPSAADDPGFRVLEFIDPPEPVVVLDPTPPPF